MFVQYDPETGQIMAHVSIPEEDQGSIDWHTKNAGPLVRDDGECSTETHYVESGRVVERPAMPLSISGTTITGIPAGSVLTLGEQEYQVDDGEAEIDGYSGTVKITCWPYLDAEVVV